MAKGFNKVILMGNLTRDPELRITPNGQSVCNFGLAVNRTWRGADGQNQESVSYIDCVAWGKTGEILKQYLQKGRPVLVSGRLDQRSWEADGQKRSKIEVIVEDFNFVDSGNAGRSNDSGSGSYSQDSGSSAKSSKKKDDVAEDLNDEPINLDDIPF